MTPAGPLRVLVVDHTAALGGAELALARLLEALDPADHRVQAVLFSDGPLVARLTGSGVPTTVVPLADDLLNQGRGDLLRRPDRLLRAGGRLLRFVVGLRRELRRRRPDLVVTNSLKSALLAGPAARLAGVPWVWHLHDRLSPDYLPAPVATGLRLLARFGPRRVVVNSADAARWLGRPPAGHVLVAHPGLDATAFVVKSARPDPRAEPTRIGILGRISSTKGQQEFVRAGARVLSDHPEARLVVIGRALFNDAPYEAELHALIERSGLADRVDLIGWTPDPTAALAGLSLLVHASPVPEPFGQVVVEGMAAGVPVIATRAGGVTEILDPDGEIADLAPGAVGRTAYGQLVVPGDVVGLAAAMAWVLDDPDAAATLAARAQESAGERFGIDRTAAAVSAAWAQAVG